MLFVICSRFNDNNINHQIVGNVLFMNFPHCRSTVFADKYEKMNQLFTMDTSRLELDQLVVPGEA